jgi:hypothetical protein
MDSSFSIEDIRKFALDWNTKYPIDRYWRKKHKVAFNSELHRQTSLLDMRIEFEEDGLFKEAERVEEKDKFIYQVGTNNYLKPKAKFAIMSEEETDDLFDQIDVTQIKEIDDKTITLR